MDSRAAAVPVGRSVERWSLAAALLTMVVCRRHLRKSWPRREDLPRFAACGLVGHTAHVGLLTWGISLSTPFSSALVLTSGPLFTVLIPALAGAEKLRARQFGGGHPPPRETAQPDTP
ncbi:MAG TPA: hypothetical protein VLX30_15930 [Burkholderiales bacterium]|nr:hypothetical protein [Burkholderiales bacterium]